MKTEKRSIWCVGSKTPLVVARSSVLIALAWVSATLHAAQPYQEYREHIESAQKITALNDDLMDDSVSLYNCATEFTATDISLTGNNALPVKLSRHFYDWNLEMPSISGIFRILTGA